MTHQYTDRDRRYDRQWYLLHALSLWVGQRAMRAFHLYMRTRLQADYDRAATLATRARRYDTMSERPIP